LVAQPELDALVGERDVCDVRLPFDSTSKQKLEPSLGSFFTLRLLMGVATCGRTVTADKFVKATPVSAILLVPSQVPGVAYDNRSPTTERSEPN